jgi:hypothetical protein
MSLQVSETLQLLAHFLGGLRLTDRSDLLFKRMNDELVDGGISGNFG